MLRFSIGPGRPWADGIGDRTYVSAVERSKWNISLSNIERLFKALDVAPWTFLKPLDSE